MSTKVLPVLVALWLISSLSGWAAEKSDLLANWTTAKSKADQQMAAQFQRQIQVLKSNRNLPAETRHRHISDLQEQRTNFQKRQELPAFDLMLPSTVAYLDTLHTAATPIREQFDRRLEQLVGTPEFEQVSAAKQHWQQSLPGRDEIAAGADFHGTRTFLKGTAVDFHFHVRACEHDSFSGQIWQDVHNVGTKTGWAYEAKLEGNRILLTTTKMLHGQPRKLDFRGYIIDRRIVMTLTHKDGKPLTGDLVSVWKK